MLRCDVTRADALGTTALSIEEIGEVELDADAKRVVMIMAQVVSTGAQTTAEAVMGKILIDSQDLDITEQEIDGLLNIGGSPGTNFSAVSSRLLKLPCLYTGEDLGKNKIKFRYDAIVPEPTSEVAAQCFVVFDDGSTPPAVLEALWQGYPLKSAWTDRASDDEIGDVTSELMDESFSIPGKFGKVTRYIANLAPDAVYTADEHFLGSCEFTSTISKLGVQKWPLPCLNPSLGTMVGAPVQAEIIDLPLYWPTGSKAESFYPTAVIQQVTTGANALQISLGVQK